MKAVRFAGGSGIRKIRPKAADFFGNHFDTAGINLGLADTGVRISENLSEGTLFKILRYPNGEISKIFGF